MNGKKLLLLFLIALFAIPNAVTAAEGKTEFERMTDDFFETALRGDNIAGAAVTVIQDGAVLFEKGYGYADLENKIPVEADQTAFQIASVSKLFTATAVMQLAERGLLSLDEDVNHYLTAFQIENPFDTPVTLRTLLTHTSGIDDRMPLYLPSTGELYFESLPALETVMKEAIAPVVTEPGSFCQYQVFGMALAGYIAEVASGMPLEEYITESILKPLHMEHSSYGLTKEIIGRMSKPYLFDGKEYKQGRYTLINDHPSGSICATASDMGKFITAHLNNALLPPEAEATMQTHQYPENERLTGYSLGFYEAVRNGYRTLEHGGALPSFSSKLSMLPDQGLGVFIAVNTKSKTSGSVINRYIDAFYTHFTENNAAIPERADFDLDPGRLSGNYSGGYGRTDFTKIKSVLDTCTVECDADGTLTYIGQGEKWSFYYVGDGMFFCKDNANYLQIREENGTPVLHVLGGDYEKTAKLPLLLFRIITASLPFLLVSIVVLLCLLFKKKQAVLPLIQSLLILIYFCLNLGIPLFYMKGDTAAVLSVIKPLIPIVCWSNLVLIPFTGWYTVKLWRFKTGRAAGRVWRTLITGLALCCAVFMFFMNGFDW